MVDSEKPVHRGNQAFIDEDYPTTLQVHSRLHNHAAAFVLRPLSYGRVCGRVDTGRPLIVRQAWEYVRPFLLALTRRRALAGILQKPRVDYQGSFGRDLPSRTIFHFLLYCCTTYSDAHRGTESAEYNITPRCWTGCARDGRFPYSNC